MRNISVLTLLLLIVPGVASSQSLELFGSAGPTITDTGNSFAVGAGFSPTSRITLAFNFERTHLSTQTSRDGDVVSTFRGGTLFLGTAEFRYAPFGRARVRPFGLAGFAAGVSRPNVNDRFQEHVTNGVRAFFAGGGIDVPVSEQLSVFADVRMMLGAEGNDGMFGVAPARVGVRFAF